MGGAGNHRARAHARSPDRRGDRRLCPQEFHAAYAGITGDTLVKFRGGERLAPCACVTFHPSDDERNVTRSSSRTAFESILSLASGRFCRRAPLALAREGRGRSSLLRFLLLGLLGFAVAALFTFGHGLSPLLVSFREGWTFSLESAVEQMIEVGHHAVNQLTPAWIGRSFTLGEEAQQVTSLLDRRRPSRGRSGREQICECRLSRVQRRLICFDLRSQPAQLGCLLGCHAAVRVEAGRVIRHGPISRVHRLVAGTFKRARSAAGPASWLAVRSVRPARAARDATRAREETSPRPRGSQAARGAKRVGLRG